MKEYRADRFVIMGTNGGVIKKTELSALQQSSPGRHHRPSRLMRVIN